MSSFNVLYELPSPSLPLEPFQAVKARQRVPVLPPTLMAHTGIMQCDSQDTLGTGRCGREGHGCAGWPPSAGRGRRRLVG